MYTTILYRQILCDMSSFLSFFFFKQKTAYEMRISDWSSDVCSSDLSVQGSHLCSYAPLRSSSPAVVRSDAAGDPRPAGEISAPRPSVRLRTFGYTSPVRSHAGQRKHESQAPAVAAAKSSLPSSIFAVRRNMVDVTPTCVSRYSRRGLGRHGHHPSEITGR